MPTPSEKLADDNRVEVLFLTGQPGAGKSAVAKEIGELLWRIREPQAIIDIDELCRGVLPTQTANFNRTIAVANLKAVWANFYTAGIRRLILARIIESLEDLEQFGCTIPNAHITVCFLSAPQEAIQQRIAEREPGSSRAFLLKITSSIGDRIAGLELPGIHVNNHQRPITEVAREILNLAGWPYPSD